MALKRVLVQVEGVVQGVYFRDYTQQEARRLGLSGWARNRADGTVEVVLEGDAAKIDEMIQWLHSGSPMAQVSGVHVVEEALQGVTTPFSIRYN
ncbi:MAG: acylphosphatase [Desulfobulbaceae bacterium]|nr:acylphosphatase [Desulfobulbaceae bacterium]HIJ79013.1 acylphosphatase [Deltaproteobacteria bacterium]